MNQPFIRGWAVISALALFMAPVSSTPVFSTAPSSPSSSSTFACQAFLAPLGYFISALDSHFSAAQKKLASHLPPIDSELQALGLILGAGGVASLIAQVTGWGIGLGISGGLSLVVANLWQSSEPQNPDFKGSVVTTHMSVEDERSLLTHVLAELDKEIKTPGSAQLPKAIVISDQHGSIERFDALLLDALRSVLPPDTLPVDFAFHPDQSLEEALEPFGISLNETFKGKLFIHNLGDFMDRGKYGVKIFRRSLELMRAGLSSFVIGNHDFWEFLNLQGFHLPWYEGYNFYGYQDPYGDPTLVLKEKHRMQRETRTKPWWAEKLADFTAYHQKRQKEIWDDLDTEVNGRMDPATKKRVKGDGLYARVSSSLKGSDKELWDQFRGNAFKTEIYTGVRAVGLVSVQWWEELLSSFESAYSRLQEQDHFNPELESAKAWQRAIQIMQNDILPVVRQDYAQHMEKGEWWWQIFEALDKQNYTSPEWWAKDWIFHEGWGTFVLKELNELIQDPAQKVTPSNYLNNLALIHFSEFSRDHFSLYERDIYQNTYIHGFMPVDEKTGEFFFVYKGQEYRGRGGLVGQPSVWEGLDLITSDIRNPQHNMRDLYEAFALVNSFYADNTTQAKVPNVAHVINRWGAQNFLAINGIRRLYSGHLPFHEFHGKLTEEERGVIAGFHTDDVIFFVDHGMGEKFGERGAYVDVSVDGVRLRGYPSKESAAEGIVWDPPTAEGAGESMRILFENKSVPRERHLKTLKHEVASRIQVLTRQVQMNPQTPSTLAWFWERLFPGQIENNILRRGPLETLALGLFVTNLVATGRLLGLPIEQIPLAMAMMGVAWGWLHVFGSYVQVVHHGRRSVEYVGPSDLEGWIVLRTSIGKAIGGAAWLYGLSHILVWVLPHDASVPFLTLVFGTAASFLARHYQALQNEAFLNKAHVRHPLVGIDLQGAGLRFPIEFFYQDQRFENPAHEVFTSA